MALRAGRWLLQYGLLARAIGPWTGATWGVRPISSGVAM